MSFFKRQITLCFICVVKYEEKHLIMNTKFSRTKQIIGAAYLEKIENTKLIIFGVGGVGGQALESLVRAGFTKITIVDYDNVEITNFNRQLLATNSSLGESKVKAALKRCQDINEEVKINTVNARLTGETINEFKLNEYDYVIDAIDDFSAKIALIRHCLVNKINIISSMGAGNRLDPTNVRVGKIEQTFACPLAKKIRTELRKSMLTKLNVVYSEEYPRENKSSKPGSSPFVPPAFGLAIASFVFEQLMA